MARSDAARPRFTLDSNLLVYSVDNTADERHALSAQIVLVAARLDCCLTLQSVSEFYAVVTHKRIIPGPLAAARANDWLTVFPNAAASTSAVRAALAASIAGQASYWDALLIATAVEAGCTLILTEDLQDGSTLGGVEIHNPFGADGGLTVRTRQLLGL